MTRTSLKIAAFIAGLAISGSAFAAPHLTKPATGDFSPIHTVAGSLAAPGGSTKRKICENTYHPGGIRCTTCTYSNYPEYVSTKCIKVRTQGSSSGTSQNFNGLSGSNRLRFR